jgi:hypothetical protein
MVVLQRGCSAIIFVPPMGIVIAVYDDATLFSINLKKAY